MECVYPDASALDGGAVGVGPARTLRSSRRSAEAATASSSTPTTTTTLAESYESNTDTLSEPMTPGYGLAPSPSARPDRHLVVDDGSGELDDDDLGESRGRRVLELRLLHHYILNQSKAFDRPLVPPELSDPARAATEFHWGVELVEMSFEDDSIHYLIMAHSALSKMLACDSGSGSPSSSDGGGPRDEWRRVQQRYLSLALREQRAAVARLSADNADRVGISSLMILNHAFALVQTLPVDPWQPPSEWLEMGRGTGQVLMVARSQLGLLAGTDRMTRFMNSPPYFDPDVMFSREHRAHLVHLLEAPPGVDDLPPEMRDRITASFYNRMLSYLGWIERRAADGDLALYTVRRLVGFAPWAPDVLRDFLHQRRPRALVVLAYFFSLWIPYEHIWVVGTTGRRQLAAIYRELPPAWRVKLDPLMDRYEIPR